MDNSSGFNIHPCCLQMFVLVSNLKNIQFWPKKSQSFLSQKKFRKNIQTLMWVLFVVCRSDELLILIAPTAECQHIHQSSQSIITFKLLSTDGRMIISKSGETLHAAASCQLVLQLDNYGLELDNKLFCFYSWTLQETPLNTTHCTTFYTVSVYEIDVLKITSDIGNLVTLYQIT